MKLLNKKNVPQKKAEWAIRQTLDIAVNHQLDLARREQYFANCAIAKKHLRQLRKQVNSLVQALSKLPPASKGKLNKIIRVQDWRQFDTEALAEIIRAMMDTLPKVSPHCYAEEARSAISDTILRDSKEYAVAQIVRTAPPAILVLWEMIPAQTRTKVEEDIRTLSLGISVLDFFQHLPIVLAKSPGRMRDGRTAIERVFAQKIAWVWRALGLRVGRVFGESYFQQYCRRALSAVGDDTRISGRQVRRLKALKE
jgi:hypothetical protein